MCPVPDEVTSTSAKAATVKTEVLRLNDETFSLKCGDVLPGIEIAYQSWGTLNEDGSNAILLSHALSGSHHASGYNPDLPEAGELWKEELHAGWWDEFMGPGKALDTDEYFIVCANYLGGCYGTTGPRSINPASGKPYGSKFPQLSVSDQVKMQAALIDALGISKLRAVVGPSVGGLVALSFAATYPDRVKTVIPIASGLKTTVLNRLILFEQILAIENDPLFQWG